tara:strand:- start:8949 stop:10628 length:1680 start_codon:yes stop_codon:yes gene_type:complete
MDNNILKYWSLLGLLVSVVFISCGTKKSINDRPDISSYSINKSPRIEINDSLFFKGTNSLRKNKYGQWELIVSGNPLEIGNDMGVLSSELIKDQEKYFFNKVTVMVPSKFKRYLLRNFLSWYARKMYLNVTEEYKTEVYGISKFGISDNRFFGSNYLKTLFLHSAHDIGHAFQDLAIVGCSSFAVWGDKTADGNLLVARNFDFYAGDKFAKVKQLSFINPDKGFKYMSVSWPGMIGVVSGMNEKGITVTINAAKSDIPLVAKTPISFVTKEIIQYASTISEAIEIAKKRKVFVSESILVGSAIDNKAIIIEMSPDNFGVFDVENATEIICSNHFQSDVYSNDENNIKAISESHSKYRFDKMNELLAASEKMTPEKVVSILRNKKGLNDLEIGYGNEKALNQLLAHHGIVFQPSKKIVWVSSNPYVLGDFVAFQLDSVFNNLNKKSSTLSLSSLLIKKDSFAKSDEFKNYEAYRIEKRKIKIGIKNKEDYSQEELEKFISLNPNLWEVYYLTGKYYFEKKYYKAALLKFNEALTKEVTTVPDQEKVKKYILKIKRKLNDS